MRDGGKVCVGSVEKCEVRPCRDVRRKRYICGFSNGHNSTKRSIVPMGRPHVATLLGFIPSAWSHAFIDQADPAVSSRRSSSPGVEEIGFTKRLQPALSKTQEFYSPGSEQVKRDTEVEMPSPRPLIVSVHDSQTR